MEGVGFWEGQEQLFQKVLLPPPQKGTPMTSKENKQGLFDSLGRASVMGLHMVSGIIVGCLLGYWLDKWFGTYPWCAGVGLIVGIGAGFRNIWLDARILLRQGEQDDAGKKRQK